MDEMKACPKCGEVGGRHIYNEFGEVVYCSEDAPSCSKKYDKPATEKAKTDAPDSTGARLETVMNGLGYSRTKLAKDTGISYQTIKRMCELDRYGSLAAWLIVCETLGISIKEVTQ